MDELVISQKTSFSVIRRKPESSVSKELRNDRTSFSNGVTTSYEAVKIRTTRVLIRNFCA
jgi:hypothetical protein